MKDLLLPVRGPYNIPESLRHCVVQAVMGLPCDQNCRQFWVDYQSFQELYLVGAKLVNPTWPLERAKLRKTSKVEFVWANSDFGEVEMVSLRPVLAQIVQNEPRGAKLALKTLSQFGFWGQFDSLHFTV